MRAYAHQAKNRQMEIDAAEIRIRAERRLGQLMAEQRAAGLLHKGGRPRKKPDPDEDAVSRPITLADIGLTDSAADRARKLAAVPDAEFNDMVEDWQRRMTAEDERVTANLLRAGEKALSRQAKEAALADTIRTETARLGEKRYGVICADPPWRFEPYSRETGMDRAADNHYPTMTVEEIAALDVPAAKDCALFLWATAPMLPEAVNVLASWGFAYRSHLI